MTAGGCGEMKVFWNWTAGVAACERPAWEGRASQPGNCISRTRPSVRCQPPGSAEAAVQEANVHKAQKVRSLFIGMETS